jgi:hypothetical protein
VLTTEPKIFFTKIDNLMLTHDNTVSNKEVFCRFACKEEYVLVEVFTDMASGKCSRVESEDGNPPEKKIETIPFILSGVMHLRSSGGRLKQFSSVDPSVNAEKQTHFYYFCPKYVLTV